jgi:hypothetical protein
MMYAILFGASLLLLGGFLMLVALERAKGVRVAAAGRRALDRKVARLAFIVRHVDWGAFVKHLTGTALERVLHDVAHGILRIVRITERLLTRTVRTLRERRGLAVEETPQEDASRFARGLEKVRLALRNSRRPARPRKGSEEA